MHTFFQELGLYLWAVLAHWQSYVTGGLVTAIVNVWERYKNTTIPWRHYVAIFLLSSGLVAFFYAWHDEHRNTQVVIDEKARAYSDLSVCNGHLEGQTTKADFLDNQNHSLQQTINGQLQSLTAQQQTMNSQQGTLNGCVVALGKRGVGPELRVSVFLRDLPTDKKPPTFTAVILLTNRLTKIRGNLSCHNPFRVLEFDILGTSVNSGEEVKPVDDRKWLLAYQQPNWEPGVPLLALVTSDNGLDDCNFEPQQ